MIAKGAGQSLHAYAREALFDPAGGIGATEWVNGEDGNESAASGLRMTPRDLARVGQLMLAGGLVDNKRRVVAQEWIDLSTTPVAQVDENRQYGFHWYTGYFAFMTPTRPRWSRARLERYWGAFGNGGQRLFILPCLDLVLAITAGNYDTPDQWVPPVRTVGEVVLPSLL